MPGMMEKDLLCCCGSLVAAPVAEDERGRIEKA